MSSAYYLLSVRRSWWMCGGYTWLWGKFWLYQWYRFILLWLQERLLRWWWNLRRWEIYVNNLQLIKYCKVTGGNNVILFCNVLPCDKTKNCDILKELGIDRKLSRTPVRFIKLVLTINCSENNKSIQKSLPLKENWNQKNRLHFEFRSFHRNNVILFFKYASV